MSESENLHTIQRLYDDFLAIPDRFSSTSLLDFFDPDVEINQSASLLGSEGTFHGYEGLARSGREVLSVFRGMHWVPIRLEGRGEDVVVATVESRGFGKASGVEVRVLTVHTWTLRNGRIVRWDVRIDHADPENS